MKHMANVNINTPHPPQLRSCPQHLLSGLSRLCGEGWGDYEDFIFKLHLYETGFQNVEKY